MQEQKQSRKICEKARAKKVCSHEIGAFVKTPKANSEHLRTSYTRWCCLNKQRSCPASEKTTFEKSLMELYCEPVYPDEKDDIFQYKCKFHSCLKSPIPPVLEKFLQETTLFHNCPHRKYRLKAPLSTIPLNIARNKSVCGELRLDELTRKKCSSSGPRCKIHCENENSRYEQKNRPGVESCQYITFPKQTSDFMNKKESSKLTRQRRLSHQKNRNELFCRTTSCPYSKYKILDDCPKKQNSSCCSKYFGRNNSKRSLFAKQNLQSDGSCIFNLKYRKTKNNEDIIEKICKMTSTSESCENSNETNENAIWELDKLSEKDDENEFFSYDEPTDGEKDLEENENEETVSTYSRENNEDSTYQDTVKTLTKSYYSKRCSCSLCEIDLYIKKLNALITTYDPFLSPYSPIDKLQKIEMRKKRRILSSRKYFKTSRCVCYYSEKEADELRKIPFSEMSYIYNVRHKADPIEKVKIEIEKWKGNKCERKRIPCDRQSSSRSTEKVEQDVQEK